MNSSDSKLHTSNLTLAGSYLLIVIVVFSSFAPFIWVVSAAFDEKPQLWLTTPQLSLKNFVTFFSGENGLSWLFSSFVYAVGTLALVIAASALGGYTLSRLDFWWKTPFLYFIILIRIIPKTVFIVPLFKLISSLSLLDTYFSVILVDAAFALPLALWIMKTFYDTIPIDLEEAAWIDGASRLTSLIRVVLPLSAPGVAAISVITFNAAWGTFLAPLIFISSPDKLPLGVGIFRAYASPQFIDYGFLAALAIIFIIPTLTLYIFCRKFLIRSFNLGGVKE